MCLTLSEHQLSYKISGGYGSVRETLVHLVRSEERYLAHLRGHNPDEIASPTLTTSLTELKNRLQQSGAGLVQLVANFDAHAQVRIEEDDKVEWIPATVFLLQALYHAHEHRTQINTLLGQLGVPVPALNAWDYYDEELVP